MDGGEQKVGEQKRGFSLLVVSAWMLAFQLIDFFNEIEVSRSAGSAQQSSPAISSHAALFQISASYTSTGLNPGSFIGFRACLC